MTGMRNVVIPLDRTRRVDRAVAARRRLHDTHPEHRSREHTGGRAWVNGSELGGARAAFAHLAECYD
jgi:hypothetical protein